MIYCMQIKNIYNLENQSIWNKALLLPIIVLKSLGVIRVILHINDYTTPQEKSCA